jgi:cytochrome c-type biogenesis protein CcsB
MNKAKNQLSVALKLLAPLFNTRAAGMYILLFAAAIAIGTFIENDYGTSSAQHVVYKSWWFSLLLVLFCVTILTNIKRFRMLEQRKWALLLFHASMVIILIGAGVTRYFGYEGVMHIRENDSSSSILSAETFIQLQILQGDQKFKVDEQVLFSSLGNNHWEESFLLGNDLIELEVKEFIPNPKEVMTQSPDGKPTIKIVFGGLSGREEYYLSQGQKRRIRNVTFNFNPEPTADAINISLREGALYIQSDQTLIQTVMATQLTDTLYPQNEPHNLMLRSLYTDGLSSFVFGDYKEQAVVKIESENIKVKNESMTVLRMDVRVNGVSDELLVYGRKGSAGRPAVTHLDKLSLAVSYGSKDIALPFSVKLYDFILEKYPGTNSPTSYASEVQLNDARSNISENHRIFMNHVMDHDGFRFFQSSYDQDELGTYLSVNHDFWGTWISYIGYALLTIGMVMSLLSKKSRFYKVSQSIKNLRSKNASLILAIGLFGFPLALSAQKTISQTSAEHIVSVEHAELFSRVIVQDHKGRMKPMHTLTRELMRKVLRKERYDGLSADQVILGMFAHSPDWINVPLIKLGHHETIHDLLNVPGSLASYSDFFTAEGGYKLRDEVRRASSAQPIDRGVLEKELIKIDERVNIMNMVFGGHFFKLIPVPGDPNNTWVGPHSSRHGQPDLDNPVADKFFSTYLPALSEAMRSNDYSLPNKLLTELRAYQNDKGAAVMPSPSKIDAEIFLNELNIFNRLAATYAILGVLFLFFLFFSVFKPEVNLRLVYKILFGVLLLGFILHTVGLGLRWYVSGRAPWSNGYESMIYIAWTTVLAGVLFARKSFGALAATMVLSATVLLVAMLSYLDPEITPLVPVLRSYWLTIHVSLEAGSYGFLMLGAVIGLINLILMIFLTTKNEQRIYRIVKEMTYLSEMTLIGGLFMISIGTYLGGVWANESWGRYWGWDAKETWALVTILVYAFILHMRLIPKMGGLFAFNFASIFGMASVIMTYYGVNYYLSGLHSYAAGDPVPVPQWVYIAVACVLLISLLAWVKKRKYKLIS